MRHFLKWHCTHYNLKKKIKKLKSMKWYTPMNGHCVNHSLHVMPFHKLSNKEWLSRAIQPADPRNTPIHEHYCMNSYEFMFHEVETETQQSWWTWNRESVSKQKQGTALALSKDEACCGMKQETSRASYRHPFSLHTSRRQLAGGRKVPNLSQSSHKKKQPSFTEFLTLVTEKKTSITFPL